MTAPPNYKWQQLLERGLPAYAPDKITMLPMTKFDGREHKKEHEVDEEPSSKPKLNIKHTLMKWFIDCMTIGALLNTVAFLTLMGLLKGQPRAQIVNNLRTVSPSHASKSLVPGFAAQADDAQETLPIIVNSYKIWPVASIVNFAFIPVEKRIVFLSCIGLIWNIYLSLVAASI